MARGLSASIAALLALTLPAGALAGDDLFSRPEACARRTTVQYSDCRVDTVFHCNEGAVRSVRIETYRDEGLTQVEYDDPDGNPIDIGAPDGSFRITMQRKPDPMSLRRALSAGRDSFDFQVRAHLTDSLSGSARMSGSIERTADTVTVGGTSYPGLRLRYRMRFEGGGEIGFDGLQFYDPAAETSLSAAKSASTVNGQEVGQHDDRVIEVLHAGDRGFDSETPRYGCGSLTWNLPPAARSAS